MRSYVILNKDKVVASSYHKNDMAAVFWSKISDSASSDVTLNEVIFEENSPAYRNVPIPDRTSSDYPIDKIIAEVVKRTEDGARVILIGLNGAFDHQTSTVVEKLNEKALNLTTFFNSDLISEAEVIHTLQAARERTEENGLTMVFVMTLRSDSPVKLGRFHENTAWSSEAALIVHANGVTVQYIDQKNDRYNTALVADEIARETYDGKIVVVQIEGLPGGNDIKRITTGLESHGSQCISLIGLGAEDIEKSVQTPLKPGKRNIVLLVQSIEKYDELRYDLSKLTGSYNNVKEYLDKVFLVEVVFKHVKDSAILSLSPSGSYRFIDRVLTDGDPNNYGLCRFAPRPDGESADDPRLFPAQ